MFPSPDQADSTPRPWSGSPQLILASRSRFYLKGKSCPTELALVLFLTGACLQRHACSVARLPGLRPGYGILRRPPQPQTASRRLCASSIADIASQLFSVSSCCKHSGSRKPAGVFSQPRLCDFQVVCDGLDWSSYYRMTAYQAVREKSPQWMYWEDISESRNCHFPRSLPQSCDVNSPASKLALMFLLTEITLSCSLLDTAG